MTTRKSYQLSVISDRNSVVVHNGQRTTDNELGTAKENTMNTRANNHTLGTIATLVIALFVFTAGSAQSATWNWTGATSNSLNVDTNWAEGTMPTGIGTDQPSTPAIGDTLVFDGSTWTRAPRTLYSRTNRKWGSIEIPNGTVTWKNDGNNQGNYSWGGTTTMVVGDGDATAAVANFNVMNWNQGGTTGTKTYVVNSDGTLASARGGTHNWSNGATYDTVMQLLGGAVNITGQLQESQITADAGDYVTFDAAGSTFKFTKGTAAGRFDDDTDVTGAFGDSFRLGGSLNTDGLFILSDDGTNWTISAQGSLVVGDGSVSSVTVDSVYVGPGGATLEWDFVSPDIPGTTYDQIVGDLDLTNGPLTIDINALGTPPSPGDTFTLFTGTINYTGNLDDNIILTGDYSDSWVISEGSLILTANAVPEPSTAILAGLGLAGVCFRRRRR